MSEMRSVESEKVKFDHYTVGSLYDGLLDQWLNVQVQFRLSSKRDGYLVPSVNGRQLGKFVGRTMLPSGWLEVRYGIYQSGTNQFQGGSSAMPTQVAYFSDVGLFAAV
jgi:hypothetical protein